MPLRRRPHPALPARARTLALPLALPLALAAAGGCASTAEPLQPPGVVSVVSYYAGDPVGGALPEGAALALELRGDDAVEVRMELLIVTAPLPEEADPLSEHVRLVLGGEGEDAMGAHPSVLQGARLAKGDLGGRLAAELRALGPDARARVERLEGLSIPGVATRMSTELAQRLRTAETGVVDRRFGVETWQGSGSAAELSVALVLRDLVESIGAEGDSGELGLRRERREEILVLGTPLLVGGPPLVMMSPPRFDMGADVRLALILEAGAAPDRGASGPAVTQDRMRRIQAEVRDGALEGAERRQQLRFQERELIRLQESLSALSDPSARRAALLDLAGVTRADLTEAFCLVAGEEALAAFTEGLAADRDVLRALAANPPDLAWRLERELLVDLLERAEGDGLDLEYEALLLEFTGDAGRQLGVVQDAILASSSIDAFRARLMEDNRIALESSSPAARIRAYDWLARAGLVVPGYDPLGPSRDRRRALREWEAAQAASDRAEGAEAER